MQMEAPKVLGKARFVTRQKHYENNSEAIFQIIYFFTLFKGEVVWDGRFILISLSYVSLNVTHLDLTNTEYFIND